MTLASTQKLYSLDCRPTSNQRKLRWKKSAL